MKKVANGFANEPRSTVWHSACGYIGVGGEYSFGFIPIIGSAVKGVGGLYDRLGLRTFINLRAGLYNADTDYDGRFASGSFTSKLSNSN